MHVWCHAQSHGSLFSGVIVPAGMALSLRLPIPVHPVATELSGSVRVYKQAALLSAVAAATANKK